MNDDQLDFDISRHHDDLRLSCLSIAFKLDGLHTIDTVLRDARLLYRFVTTDETTAGGQP